MPHISPACQWFVPLSQLRQPGGAELLPVPQVGDREPHDTDITAGPSNTVSSAPIEAGSPFTVSLESFCIGEEWDRRSGNDLLARSWTLYGNQPPMEMVHCFKRNVALSEVVENLAIEHMFAAARFDPAQTLSLHLQILEVDGQNTIESDILTVARALGGVFPALLPFTGVAIPLYKRLKTIFDQKRTEEAFASTIHFASPDVAQESSDSSADSAPNPIAFHSGAYVLCRHPIDREVYRLQDFRLVPVAQESSPPSYAVLKVVPQQVRSHNPDDLLVNQQLAAALVNPTHSHELEVPESIQTIRQHISSLDHLQQAVWKAALLHDLQAYQRLRQLQATDAEHDDSGRDGPERDRLVRAERIQQLKASLKHHLLESHDSVINRSVNRPS